VGFRWHHRETRVFSALALSFYRLWIGAVALAVITLATGRRVTWMTMKYSWLGGLLFAEISLRSTVP